MTPPSQWNAPPCRVQLQPVVGGNAFNAGRVDHHDLLVAGEGFWFAWNEPSVEMALRADGARSPPAAVDSKFVA
jgi:hypothetical protein